MRKDNLRRYPNFYNAMLLQLTEYQVTEIEDLNYNTTFMFLRNPNEKKSFFVSLYLKSVIGNQIMAKQTLEVLENYLHSKNCKYSKYTKEKLLNLADLKNSKTFSENVINGDYVYFVENTLKDINSKTDKELKKVNENATLAFNTTMQNWYEKQAELEGGQENIEAGKFVQKCYTITFNGLDNSELMHDDASMVKQKY